MVATMRSTTARTASDRASQATHPPAASSASIASSAGARSARRTTYVASSRLAKTRAPRQAHSSTRPSSMARATVSPHDAMAVILERARELLGFRSVSQDRGGPTPRSDGAPTSSRSGWMTAQGGPAKSVASRSGGSSHVASPLSTSQ